MVKDIIKKNFGAVWPAHVANFVDHLIACRKVIGDLDKVLILAVIGDRTLSQKRTDKTASYDRLFVERQSHPEPEDINVQSISDYTEIPRETVRRKVNEMMERGWLSRDGDGFYTVTPKAAAELATLTELGVEYLAKMHAVLSELTR